MLLARRRKQIMIDISPGRMVLDPLGKKFWAGKNTYRCLRRAMRESIKLKRGKKTITCVVLVK